MTFQLLKCLKKKKKFIELQSDKFSIWQLAPTDIGGLCCTCILKAQEKKKSFEITYCI